MKRREQERQRRNGLNDFGEDFCGFFYHNALNILFCFITTAEAPKTNETCKGWSTFDSQSPQLFHPEPMEIYNPRPLPSCPLPAAKEFPIVQHPQQPHQTFSGSWPTSTNQNQPIPIEGELPQGAYYGNLVESIQTGFRFHGKTFPLSHHRSPSLLRSNDGQPDDPQRVLAATAANSGCHHECQRCGAAQPLQLLQMH